MNKLMIIGNLTRDPETRTTQNSKSVCTFSVAVNRRGQDKEADYFRVSAWGDMGANCQKYLAKGRKVAVVGRVSVHAYTGNDGSAQASLEVFAEDVEFLTPREQGGQTSQTKPAGGGFTQVEMDENDLPF